MANAQAVQIVDWTTSECRGYDTLNPNALDEQRLARDCSSRDWVAYEHITIRVRRCECRRTENRPPRPRGNLRAAVALAIAAPAPGASELV